MLNPGGRKHQQPKTDEEGRCVLLYDHANGTEHNMSPVSQ